MNSNYVAHLLKDNGAVEIRVENGVWVSHLVSTPEQVEAIVANSKGELNFFSSLNRPKPGATPPFKNSDFSWVTRLVFDFDSERPKDTPANETELQAAFEAAMELERFLAKLGFPKPAIGFSGNGWHIQYRASIAPEVYSRYKDQIYYGLERRFRPYFDIAVRNVGRILRLYGTVNFKGVPKPEEGRVHRLSWCQIPDRWEPITERELAKLAKAFPPPKPKPIAGSGQDILKLFDSAGMVIRMRGANAQVICPWEHEHTTAKRSGTYVLRDFGYDVFYCHHAHCQRRRNRDVLKFFGQA